MKSIVNQQLSLKPQDLLILLKLVAAGSKPFAYSELGSDLGFGGAWRRGRGYRAGHR